MFRSRVYLTVILHAFVLTTVTVLTNCENSTASKIETKTAGKSRDPKIDKEGRYYQGSSGYGSVQPASNDKRPASGYGSVQEAPNDKRPSYSDGYSKPSSNYKPTYQTGSVGYKPYRPKPGTKPNYQTQQQQQSGYQQDSDGWQYQNNNNQNTKNGYNKYWAQQSTPGFQEIPDLNECGSQQACNAIFLRMNFTHRLCRCPSANGKKQQCSESRDTYDGYTMELATRPIKRKAPMTLLKTCQPLSTLRPCRNPKDWSLLALQNTRTGKAQYLVTCRCPNWASLEGPVAHENPAYADIPGIRVFGMLCWSGSRGSRLRTKEAEPVFPWETAINFAKSGRLQ